MLYQLFCLARPMANGELGSLIQGIGRVVYSTGGVVCDVKSYGRQFLAYKIKGVHGKYDQANIWELEFAASPDALRQVHHELRVNEGVLRFAVLRREALPRVRIPRRRPALPSSAPIALDWRPEVGGGAADAAADATAAALLASEAELRGLRELIAAGAPAPLDAAASSRPAP